MSEKEREMRTAGETHYECDRERERVRVRDMNERARVVPPAMDRSQKTARGRYSIAYIYMYAAVSCAVDYMTAPQPKYNIIRYVIMRLQRNDLY